MNTVIIGIAPTQVLANRNADDASRRIISTLYPAIKRLFIPQRIVDVNLAILSGYDFHLAVNLIHGEATPTVVYRYALAQVSDELALRLFCDYIGSDNRLKLGQHGVPLVKSTKAVVVGPVATQAMALILGIIAASRISIGVLQRDGSAIDDVNSLVETIVNLEIEAGALNIGGTHGNNNVCLIVVAPVNRLAQGHVNLFALDIAFYPAVAKVAAAAAEDVLDVNNTVLSENDV